MNIPGVNQGTMDGIIQVLGNLESSYPGLYEAMFGFCSVAGLLTLMISLNSFRKLADTHGSQEGVGGAIWGLVTALMLFYIPSTIDVIAVTAFSNSTSLISYETAYSQKSGSPLDPLFHFVQFVGFITYIRAIFMLREVGKNGNTHNASFGKSMVFLSVGIAGIYIRQVIQIFSSTFGFGLPSGWL